MTGLERFEFGKRDFVIVGERCNVAGSRKFLRLINEHKYDEALDIARTQIEKGAMVVDVNMDDGLLDTRKEMTQFLNLLMSDPSVCRVPVMVDSSRFDVIEAGLKCCQGKCIVNSISLKQGEETFVEQARRIKRLGAAVIVMLFDEEGQATDYERRISIAQRAYSLLVGKAAMSPEDIIFDPNVLTIATGMDEHRRYALDFIRATRWITENLPGARVSGGLSNLSFAFRGNNYLREAMHSVFLHHAIEAGMNMAIMNPATAMRYEDIPGNLRDAIRRVILDETPDATERLTEMAGEILRQQQEAKARLNDVRRTPDGKDNKLERYNRVSQEAAKQCGRGIAPQVRAAASLADCDFSGYDLVIVAYENEQDLKLKTLLRDRLEGRPANIAVLIGPEGGLEQGEVNFVLGSNEKAYSVTLGRRILRTETAGMAMLAMLMYELED